MSRGICPAGHLDQTGNIGDKCKYICKCGIKCDRKLKSWSSGYTSELCKCSNTKQNIHDDTTTKPIKLKCPSGHDIKHMHNDKTQCRYVCTKCGRVCGKRLQPISDIVKEEPWCECYGTNTNTTTTRSSYDTPKYTNRYYDYNYDYGNDYDYGYDYDYNYDYGYEYDYRYGHNNEESPNNHNQLYELLCNVIPFSESSYKKLIFNL